MNCEKCHDRGFIEENHGLVRVFCDCEKGRKLRAEIIGVTDDSIGGVEPDNPNPGSENSSESPEPPKPRAKKKVRARAK